MSEVKQEDKQETATETLFRAMAAFADDEPKNVIVCWDAHEGKRTVYCCVSNMFRWAEKVGLLEIIKANVINEMYEDEEEKE